MRRQNSAFSTKLRFPYKTLTVNVRSNKFVRSTGINDKERRNPEYLFKNCAEI